MLWDFCSEWLMISETSRVRELKRMVGMPLRLEFRGLHVGV